MDRRQFIKSGIALGTAASPLALPFAGLAGLADAAESTGGKGTAKRFRWVPAADLTIVDPIFTTAYVTQNHGALVYDTLYGLDDKMRVHPQMAEGQTIENNGLQWTITLREGLLFHDNTPVKARDVVASLKRWGQRDMMGQSLFAVTTNLSAIDDKTIRFTLSKPFPLLMSALARPETIIAAIMPERLANAPLSTPLKEVIGSGPFRFNASKWVSGSQVVYEKFTQYVPRKDSFAPTYTAGPKIAYVDEVDWKIIPDQATAVAALQSGEVDGIDTINNDFISLLRTDPSINLIKRRLPIMGILRFNQLQAPFDNPALRRAILSAVDQKEYMTAMVGSEFPEYWDAKTGFFAPGSPMASDAGMSAITSKRDLSKAKAAVTAAGYKGEKVVIIDPADNPIYHAAALVTVDLFKKLGIAVEVQAMDWGSAIQRRTNQAPVSAGGWSVTFTGLTGINNFDPAGHLGLRGNGKASWFGWPIAPKLEQLRDAWFAAPDLAAQQKICRDMQVQAIEDVPYVPLGSMYPVSALRKEWKDMQTDELLFFTLKHV